MQQTRVVVSRAIRARFVNMRTVASNRYSAQITRASRVSTRQWPRIVPSCATIQFVHADLIDVLTAVRSLPTIVRARVRVDFLVPHVKQLIPLSLLFVHQVININVIIMVYLIIVLVDAIVKIITKT